MDYSADSYAFDKLKSEHGWNEYQACMYIGKRARYLASKYENVPLNSECISWVLHNIPPDIIQEFKKIVYQRTSKAALISEITSLCCDTDVLTAISDTIYYSMKRKNLIYIYNKIQDEGKRARIRILSRMVWDNLHVYKGGHENDAR